MRLAARGLRDLDSGTESIADHAELAQVRRQARVVHMKSFVTAALLTALLFLV
ncbi:MAG TPA: hypothetical protein VLK88_10320 [Gemmatimonadales bacterium]|nr:hypothetical protein [Gemmatimonadales bacterium]